MSTQSGDAGSARPRAALLTAAELWAGEARGIAFALLGLPAGNPPAVFRLAQLGVVAHCRIVSWNSGCP
jgi:hypothetical protein